MRLNKYIAKAGITSRRKADDLIKEGRIKINGSVMDTPGYIVNKGDLVELDGIRIRPSEKLVYYILNKPVGYITTAKDDQDRLTVMELMKDVNERVFPVGRLDKDTSGLLIMTNDGDLSQIISHPSKKMGKMYRAKVNGAISKEKIERLRKGVDIGGFVTSPAYVELIRQTRAYSIVDIRIHEGKNRQVRKMFASVGNRVIDLERVAVGDIKLANLKPGHYRKLNREEVSSLKQ